MDKDGRNDDDDSNINSYYLLTALYMARYCVSILETLFHVLLATLLRYFMMYILQMRIMNFMNLAKPYS